MGSVYNTDSLFTTVTEFIRKQTGSNRRINTRRSGDLYYTIVHTDGQYDDDSDDDDDDDDDDGDDPSSIYASWQCQEGPQHMTI